MCLFRTDTALRCLALQVTLSAHAEQKKWDRGWYEHCCSSEVGEKENQESKRRKGKRPILKRVLAALLRLFRGQHSKEVCVVGNDQGIWSP